MEFTEEEITSIRVLANSILRTKYEEMSADLLVQPQPISKEQIMAILTAVETIKEKENNNGK